VSRLGAIIVALGIAWCMPATAETDSRKFIDALIEASGIDAHLEQVADLAATEIEERRAAMPPEEYERLRSVILPAYAPAKLRQTVVAAYLARYNSPEGKWATEVGKKALRAALAQASPP